MLHEVLLALSGHPSPLFRESELDQTKDNPDFPLLSPSERALLQSIGELSTLHRKLRQHIEQIASNHGSTICRAVANSIQQTHLSRFSQKILDVESRILTKDVSVVGAYDIVPLAGVVAEFEEWHRRIRWYWDICTCMRSSDERVSRAADCKGATLIDKLRAEQQTGFPDIEALAVELTRVAETAWLRQLASWILYGKLPAFGAEDFFIRRQNAQGQGDGHFVKDKELLPTFVTASTANSILFIGKSLHQVRAYGGQFRTRSRVAGMSERELAVVHLQHISQLSLPIVTTQLSRMVTAIRFSLSQNVLRHLLPMELTLELFSCLKQFFLLGRGEFAGALINEADSRLQARQQSMGRLLQRDPVKAMQGLSIKNTEFHSTLSATWKALASEDEDAENNLLDFARQHVSLAAPQRSDSRPETADGVNSAELHISSVSFNDLLFPSAAFLKLDVIQPLDLLVSRQEIDSYSMINAYLLSLRRSILRLSDLWRKTIARRDHPSPRSSGATTKSDTRARTSERRVATRKVWASCSAALFLLSETSAYFEGEITRESWARFDCWVREPAVSDANDDSGIDTADDRTSSSAQKDPETLASGHRIFLASLIYALLLSDVPFTRELRSLLGNIDRLVAFFTRLFDIQQKLDLEHESGGETGHTREEEQRISLELDRARKKVDSDLKSVVGRLRHLDQERIGAGRYLDLGRSERGFEAWKGGGVDRLLMKLEFGRMTEDEFDLV